MTIRRQPADVVQFTRDSAERISRVVRESENAPLPGSALEYGQPVPPQRKVFRVCTFTGSWAKGAVKTITLSNVTTTPNTVVAVNLWATIYRNGTTLPASCAIGRDGTAWYLISAEC